MTAGDKTALQAPAPTFQTLQSLGSGGVVPPGSEGRVIPERKEKKAKEVRAVVASKITLLSSKHTEIMSLDAKVKDSKDL